jgi:Tfp pilus assembly protein PilN
VTRPAAIDVDRVTRPIVHGAAAVLPRVNLLPPEVRESGRLRAVQAGVAVGVLTSGALVALVAVAAAGDEAQARAELEAARAGAVQVRAQVDELVHVREVYAEVEATEAAAAAARAREVAWSRLLSDLSLTVPDRVWIETMTVAPGSGASGGSLGSISYTGRGSSHDEVATWLETLAEQHSLADPTFTISAQDKSGDAPSVTFSSTATVTEEALASGTQG